MLTLQRDIFWDIIPRMNDDMPKTWLAQACHRLLRPLTRILLRHGIAYDDFAEVAKSVYTEVARESFTASGKRPSDANVAIVTGMTRKEVKRLRESRDSSYAERDWGGANRATRVLSGWHRDPDFTDEAGRPRVLSADDVEDGFPALVRRYSGDIPASAILAELEGAGTVATAGGQIRAQRRSFVPHPGDPESIRMLGSATHDLLHTIAHNLSRSDQEPARFQRTVFNTSADVRALPVFHRLVSEHGQQLLETLDDWLERHETGEAGQQETTRVGVGIYYFQDHHRQEGDA